MVSQPLCVGPGLCQLGDSAHESPTFLPGWQFFRRRALRVRTQGSLNPHMAVNKWWMVGEWVNFGHGNMKENDLRSTIWPFLSLFHRGSPRISKVWVWIMSAWWLNFQHPCCMSSELWPAVNQLRNAQRYSNKNMFLHKRWLYSLNFIWKKRCFDTVFWYSSNVAGLKICTKSSFIAGKWSIHHVFEHNYIIHMCYLFFWNDL